MSERTVGVLAGAVIGVWCLQSVVGAFDASLRPDPALTAGVGTFLGLAVGALLTRRGRGGNEGGE